MEKRAGTRSKRVISIGMPYWAISGARSIAPWRRWTSNRSSTSARLDRTRHGKCPSAALRSKSRAAGLGPYSRARAMRRRSAILAVDQEGQGARPAVGRNLQDCGAPMVIKTAGSANSSPAPLSQVQYTQPVPLGIKCPKCGIGISPSVAPSGDGRSTVACAIPMRLFHLEQPVAVRVPAVASWDGRDQVQDDGRETTRKCLKCGHQINVEESAPEAEEVTA